MFLFFMVSGGIYVCGLSSVTADYPHTVTRVGYDVNITMNPANVSHTYFVWGNGSVKLLVVVPRSQRVGVLNISHTGYTTRIRYTGEDSLSQTGQLRFNIYNVTVQDAGTYYCQGSTNHTVSGCRQVLVVSQKPTTPDVTGPASAVSGENVTLTCSSFSQSLPPDHPPLNMTYTWRRNRTLLESGDGSHIGGDVLPITHISRKKQGDIYTWRRNRTMLVSGDGPHTGGDVLTITHISRENQGDIYTCQAVEEGLESDWSHGHVLEVHYGPDQIQFKGASDRLKTEEGDPLTVRCSADCNPACTVTWWDTSRQREITGQREAVLYIPAVDRSVSGQYICHVNNRYGNTSRNLMLDVSSREVTGVGVTSTVPVAAVCSVLIVVTAVVVIFLFRRKQTREERGYIHNRVVTYTRDEETDESYQEIEVGGSIQNRVVSFARDEDKDGSYQEIEEEVNVDDIATLVAVYSVMLTAVAVVVAAVAILVCKDVKDGHSRRFGEYLTVVGERLSCDISDAPCAAINDEDASSLHNYERLLREQFHIYTCLNPSAFSTEDHRTRCSLM
ncbi:pregnancy-specific beta-1-glycoprotein 8-like [Haliotis cracherodii]|uniref:pregnancy-specific beta-1-glycoprotein 8-like n=1 Tax=Haliotis cracherodii TaxID=6455 RepID=UPI0039E914D5